MHIKKINTICQGQDGAVWGNYLFRFSADGFCSVYDLIRLHSEPASRCELCRFPLEGIDFLKPHSNSVVFGTEYFSPDDEFPLLYSNVYNNYARSEDPMVAVCCVYRLRRTGNTFTANPVQLIEIGFLNEGDLWYSTEEKKDLRPYGNFVIDQEKGLFLAFTMRDACHTTRYFSFPLPKVAAGSYDENFRVNRVKLKSTDILDFFDCEYHHFLQGACFHKGNVYSLEGFTADSSNPPAMRIISPEQKKQQQCIFFRDHGLTVEPEFIDFLDDTCYYSDAHGNLYTITF